MIERQILIGVITSNDFFIKIRPYLRPKYFKALHARRIARWVIDYFEKQNMVPGKNIETIFYTKLKQEKIPKEIAEEIELDILPSLSEEYENYEEINVNYLFEKAREYFQERHLELFTEKVSNLQKDGELEEAINVANNYQPIAENIGNHLDLNDERVFDIIDSLFNNDYKPLVRFPRAFGEFINMQLVRGGFVAFMGAEKRGKSFILLDIANRATLQGKKVAFFQAGDMTEGQQLKRIITYHTKKPTEPLPPEKQYTPVRDCIRNQADDCDMEERECDHGIFTKDEMIKMNNNKNSLGESGIRGNVTFDILRKKFKENPDYKPCTNCKLYNKKAWGTIWLKKNNPRELTAIDAKKAIQKQFIDKKRHFRLSSHPNGTLSIEEIERLLNTWEKQDNFIADVIIVDYADLLVSKQSDHRHAQNDIWKGLRRLSQSKSGQDIRLVVTVTQADAKAYSKGRLQLDNFSEDKRKYSHVTAMYGLNQDKDGREKKLGIMRINELVKREGDFYTNREVRILQDLKIGKPFLSSFW